MKYQFLVLPVAFVSLVACTQVESTSSTTSEVSSHPPAPAAEDHANAVADTMLNRILALLFNEFENTTADNAAVGTDAIANIFHDGNPTMRLVGDVEPLQESNLPADDFERTALALAKGGENYARTERVQGSWWVRRSLAVGNHFSTSCVHCHGNFEGLENPWVGALMWRAQIQ